MFISLFLHIIIFKISCTSSKAFAPKSDSDSKFDFYPNYEGFSSCKLVSSRILTLQL